MIETTSLQSSYGDLAHFNLFRFFLARRLLDVLQISVARLRFTFKLDTLHQTTPLKSSLTPRGHYHGPSSR